MANDEPRFLTVREVAERLRLHPITVRRHIAAGRIRAVRIGRAVRVPEAEVSKFGREETRVAETRTPYKVGSPARVEFGRQHREGVQAARLGGSAARRHPGMRPTKAQLAQRRKAVDAILRFRARQRPGPAVEQLVREGRRELDRRAERSIGLDD